MHKTAETSRERPARIPELDGIRGVAILLVLLWHCVGTRMDLDQDWSLRVMMGLNLAWTGVDLFFVLSGFLIGGIMLDNRTATNFFPVFYARRALRILPPFYLLLLAYLVVRTCLGGRTSPLVADVSAPSPPLWTYFAFLQNFFFAHAGAGGTSWLAATWSLAVEEQFYLGLPFLMFLMPRKRLWAALLVGMVAAPVFRMACYNVPPEPGYAAYVLMPARADALLLGVLGAWLVRHEPSRRWMLEHVGWLRAACLIFFAGVIGLHQSYIGYISFPMMAIGYTWLACFYWSLILVAITEPRGIVKSFARMAPLRYLGRISYTVYLLHVPIAAMVFTRFSSGTPYVHTLSDGLAMLLSILVPIGLAALSWHVLEARLVRFGHSFPYCFGGEKRRQVGAFHGVR